MKFLLKIESLVPYLHTIHNSERVSFVKDSTANGKTIYFCGLDTVQTKRLNTILHLKIFYTGDISAFGNSSVIKTEGVK